MAEKEKELKLDAVAIQEADEALLASLGYKQVSRGRGGTSRGVGDRSRRPSFSLPTPSSPPPTTATTANAAFSSSRNSYAHSLHSRHVAIGVVG